MERLSDAAIEIVNTLHGERLDYDSEYIPVIDALIRLAAYEDTGLEPEKIRKSDEMLRAFIDHNRTTEYPRTLDWLLRITKAEVEGRLLVLPCKVGDPVYYLTGNPILASGYHFNRVESTKCIGFYFDEKGLQICLYMPHGNHSTYGYYGKTIFLTREEAEAALKAEEE